MVLNKLKSLYYFTTALFVSIVSLFVAKSSVMGQEIDSTNLEVTDTVGKIDSLQGLFIWIANFMKYIGWAGVIIGIVIIIALLIYKLIGSDDTETMKKVQGGITKAVVIVILGLLLLGAGFLVNVLAKAVGSSATYGLGGNEAEEAEPSLPST